MKHASVKVNYIIVREILNVQFIFLLNNLFFKLMKQCCHGQKGKKLHFFNVATECQILSKFLEIQINETHKCNHQCSLQYIKVNFKLSYLSGNDHGHNTVVNFHSSKECKVWIQKTENLACPQHNTTERRAQKLCWPLKKWTFGIGFRAKSPPISTENSFNSTPKHVSRLHKKKMAV